MLGMAYDPLVHNRRSTRLRWHDYAGGGVYFVTICAQGRVCLFGEIAVDEMALSEFGRVAGEEWLRSGEMRQEVTLDAFVVMPNHVHGLVSLPPPGSADVEAAKAGEGAPDGREGAVRAAMRLAPRGRRSLGAFVGAYKAAVTARINTLRGSPGVLVWQRNYYEHVVRDEADLERIRRYIMENPARWALDRENPEMAGR